MLFQKKSRAKGKRELLSLENVRVNCKPDTQENVIRTVGQMLVDAGYVNQSYIEAMLEREKTVSTYMGSALALPHGVEAAKKEIKSSGIAVMIFPDGTSWGNETAKVVIGIAGVGEEHLDILSVIADRMMDEAAAKELTSGTADAQTIYKILTGRSQIA